MSDEHESFIKTPQQLITVVVLAFVVPILVIVLLVKYVGSGTRTGAGADTMTAEAIEARIRPVAGFELASAGGAGELKSGEAVYTAQCAACHATGVAGAPKHGDKAAWADRIKTGFESLVNSSLKGKGAMAPQGGGAFSDIEIARAVAYLANAGGGKFEEPKAAQAATPAAAAPAPAPAAAAAPAAAPAPAPAPAAAAPAAAPAPVASAEPAADGKKVYDTTCGVCHNTGVAGAPKLNDKAAWAERVKAGIDTLVQHSIDGIRAMPPRGGNAKLTDAELRAAVEYMVASVK